MDGFHITMLVLAIISMVSFSVNLVRAIRRHDGERVLDFLVTAPGVVVFYVTVFWPEAIHAAVAPVRWLALALLVLLGANLFGFSRWLYRTVAKPEQPVV